MKKLIFRKFYLDIVTFFVASLLIVGLIVWTIQAVNYFDFVTEDGHGLMIYFYYSLLNFPKIISKLYPFALFFSFFYIISKYEINNELMIFWNYGISKNHLINLFLKISLIFMFFQILLVSVIVPTTQNYSRNLIKDSDINLMII